MVMAAFFYATLYIAARESVRNLSVAQVAFFRSLLVVLLMSPWVFRCGLSCLYTERVALHALRAAFLYAATLTWIYALARMPIADVTAINFASPLFTVIFTLLFLGETAGAQRWAALVIGFAGVLLILRPGIVEITLPAVSALGSAAAFAGGHACARALGKTEKANLMVVYLYALSAAMGLVPALLDWNTPGWTDMGWMAIMAVLTVGAQQGLTRALIAAPASVVMPLNFLQLPFVALFGLVLFGEVSDMWTWSGAAVIFGSSYYIARRETRGARPGVDATVQTGARHASD
jgi:S-adenosylmethionine uptake transporter